MTLNHQLDSAPQAPPSRGTRLARAARVALPVLIFLVAFFPRAVGFVGSTSIWQSRSKTFMQALAAGDWGATLLAPHPGVTTMWLAGLGRWISGLWVADFDRLSLAKQSQIELLPLTLVVSLGIVLAYWLLARVFDRRVAAVAALLLALDPYHISLSKAVHVDALVSVFSMLSALYLWVFIKERARRHVLWSGVFAALAVLTKTPALFLIPYLFLVLLVWQASPWLLRRRSLRSLLRWPELAPRLRQAGAIALIWLLAFTVTYWLVWPSMWTQPLKTLKTTLGGALYYQENPHENPTYFLGHPTEQDPGPLFYPVNMAVKMTAVSLLGFLLSLPLLFRRQGEDYQRLALWLALAFVVFFSVQMTLGEKKFSRYALPALQFVIILAALGWVDLFRRLTQGRSVLLNLALALVVAYQAGVSLPRHPYYGTHYNYLLGGPRWILGHNIVSGQEKGEGLKEAAAYLNRMPMPALLVVGAQSSDAFYHYFRGKTVPLTDDKVDYVLFTRTILLRRVYAEEWEGVWEAYRDRQPKLVVSFDGVPYVWVYKTGPLIEEADIPYLVHARLGESIALLGYAFEPAQVRPGETVHLTLYWEALRQDAGDYTVFNHLLDPAGRVVGQKDNPPQGGMYPTYLWDAGERVQDEYELVVAPDAAPGETTLAVGMYTLQNMQRLPVVSEAGTSLPDDQLLLPGPEILP